MEKEIKRVTVFGGSKPQAGSPAYAQAQRLGELLALAGCTTLTGGYIGAMEAVSRGAAEAGGHVIGVTCDEIESWRPVKPNQWIHEEMRYPTIRARLYALIDNCDAALALPGGIGTLAEIAVAWSQLQVHASEPRPLIVIGDGWKNTFRKLYEELGDYIAVTDRHWLRFAPNVEAAVAQLGRLV
ncbi:MAG: LOG family protein [Chloroflexota bacterium]|nr:LOG family protein [Chloroflexota bacterium]